jgi:fermentation-respiration switch protein FrsA (DUF1100 family)
MAHFKASAVSPLEAARSLTIPLFLVHGRADTTIPPLNAEQIYAEARAPKEVWLIPGARHDNMWDVGGEEYRRRIIGFFEQHLPHQGIQ